jgi:hypothetical protein
MKNKIVILRALYGKKDNIKKYVSEFENRIDDIYRDDD